MVGPFVASIFSSAFLLFLVQPLTAKLLLPGYGGSPAVWNTALVFFQTALLVGYAYSFVLARLRSTRLQLGIHAFVLLLPLLTLPIALAPSPDPTAAPAWSMLVTLTLGVGLPFFVLATNGSLMQHWYGTATGPDSDPYWMYSASNFGSLLALAAFPLAIEPFVDAPAQIGGWAMGYGVFLLLAGWAMVTRVRSSTQPTAEDMEAADTRLRWKQRLDWTARSAVGSSLLLAVTMKITTDVGPIPLLWTVPLGLYLITFILAFAYADRMPMRLVVGITCVTACAGLGLVLIRRTFPFEIVLSIGLILLFAGALLCHTDLARTRPRASKLTEFYLWISAGGALGGVLNSLVAPVVFESVAEYPITLSALLWVAFLRPRIGDRDASQSRLYRPSILIALACVIALALSIIPAMLQSRSLGPWIWPMAALLAAGLVAAMRRYQGFIAVVPTLAAILSLIGLGEPYPVLAMERSFFGVSRVWQAEERVFMVHGSTVHGSQLRAPEDRQRTGTYYHRAGPLGATVLGAGPGSTIGIVGLGAGELAALGRPDQKMIFYEIDPVIVDLAQLHFTYLQDSDADVSTVLGDGRLTLASSPLGSIDVLILDAFSSDNVPTHLLTEEALRMYLDRLAPGGVLVAHISSRHSDLRRVFKGFSDATGLPALVRDYQPTTEHAAEGAARTLAVALANDDAVLASLRESGLWIDMPDDVASVHWTDGRSSLLDVLARLR